MVDKFLKDCKASKAHIQNQAPFSKLSLKIDNCFLDFIPNSNKQAILNLRTREELGCT